MTETLPRGVTQRIAWFLSHMPDMNNDGTYDSGACANHTWKSLGGDQGNPPRWGAPSANVAIDKIIASKRFWTPKTWKGDPPAGAIVGWRYGAHGHLAIKHTLTGKIASTNPSNGRYTGIEPLTYPVKWGYDASKGPYTVWTDTWNGVKVPVGGNTVATVPPNDFISLKDATVRTVRTNTDVLLDIKGVTRWQAEKTSGRHTLAMYVNLDLPRSGSEERKAINRGGVRVWFQQIDDTEADKRDETGYFGPLTPPVFGEQYFLVSHTWPHTADKDYWEFCVRIYAFDATGQKVDIPVGLRTREIKIIGDLT